MTTDDKISDGNYIPAATGYRDNEQPDSSMNQKEGSVEVSMKFDDKIENDPFLSTMRLKKGSKHSDMSTDRKDGSVRRNTKRSDTSMIWKENSIENIIVFDDKISNDLQTPADKVGKDRKQPEKPIDKKDNLGDDNMTEEPTKHKNKLKKVAGSHGGTD